MVWSDDTRFFVCSCCPAVQALMAVGPFCSLMQQLAAAGPALNPVLAPTLTALSQLAAEFKPVELPEQAAEPGWSEAPKGKKQKVGTRAAYAYVMAVAFCLACRLFQPALRPDWFSGAYDLFEPPDTQTDTVQQRICTCIVTIFISFAGRVGAFFPAAAGVHPGSSCSEPLVVVLSAVWLWLGSLHVCVAAAVGDNSSPSPAGAAGRASTAVACCVCWPPVTCLLNAACAVATTQARICLNAGCIAVCCVRPVDVQQMWPCVSVLYTLLPNHHTRSACFVRPMTLINSLVVWHTLLCFAAANQQQQCISSRQQQQQQHVDTVQPDSAAGRQPAEPHVHERHRGQVQPAACREAGGCCWRQSRAGQLQEGHIQQCCLGAGG